MENKNVIIGSIAVVVLVVAGVIFFMNQNQTDMTDESANTQTQTTETVENTTPDIVETASNTESLSTLVTAVQAADLVETLQGEGPFTVLAPTNAAFDALPEGTLNDLLLPENKDTLAGILTYHVISGEVLSSDLTDGQVVTTVQGEELTVSLADGMVMFTDAKGGSATVTTADVRAGNGVVHIIDTVLMPAA